MVINYVVFDCWYKSRFEQNIENTVYPDSILMSHARLLYNMQLPHGKLLPYVRLVHTQAPVF
jgi:hypothetical protein